MIDALLMLYFFIVLAAPLMFLMQAQSYRQKLVGVAMCSLGLIMVVSLLRVNNSDPRLSFVETIAVIRGVEDEALQRKIKEIKQLEINKEESALEKEGRDIVRKAIAKKMLEENLNENLIKEVTHIDNIVLEQFRQSQLKLQKENLDNQRLDEGKTKEIEEMRKALFKKGLDQSMIIKITGKD